MYLMYLALKPHFFDKMAHETLNKSNDCQLQEGTGPLWTNGRKGPAIRETRQRENSPQRNK